MDFENVLRVFFFLFGAMVGSFLNVCIVRLPQEKSIVWPGSHCCRCGKPVRWFDNIPIISYLILLGRCRDCGAGFSIRYMLVEILTGLLFLAVYLRFGMDGVIVPCFFLIGALIVATFVDFELRIIPDELSLVGIPVGVVCSLIWPGLQYLGGAVEFMPGFLASVGIVLVCFCLMVIDVWRRKVSFAREDQGVLILSVAILIAQYGLYLLGAAVPLEGLRWALLSAAASLQGVIIGGGALYVLGLLGGLCIQKRVVTLIDLKIVTEDAEALFKELRTQGYLNDEGDILPAYQKVKASEDLVLSEAWAPSRQKIYDLIQECQEGGVMGGGDVKLMALVGAFLGWKLAIFAIVLAPFFGAPVGIIEKIRTKSSAIAFGPYLAIASVVGIFWGRRIIDFVLSGYGLY